MKVSSPESLKLLMDGSLALAKIEHNGIRIDTIYLEDALSRTAKRIKKLDFRLHEDPMWMKWRRKFGSKANMGNRRQLGELLKADGFGTGKMTAKKEEM